MKPASRLVAADRSWGRVLACLLLRTDAGNGVALNPADDFMRIS
jgi:hypothetical protein